ncbi:MAG: transporter substrate-binding domain-containing protein, partial [Desulfobacterales bacterium]
MPLSTPTKIKTAIVILIFILISLAQVPSTIWAADNIDISKSIIVGVTDFPPFSLKNAEGKWSGLSIELWELIAKDIGIQYEIREFDRLKKITEAIQNEKIDLTTYVAVTELNETKMDLSHTYYRSGLGIAVPMQSSSIHWSESVKKIVSISGLKLVAILVILSLVAGVMIWLVERNRNREMFDDKFTKGLLQGIWWAMVTMTTVGYG